MLLNRQHKISSSVLKTPLHTWN